MTIVLLYLYFYVVKPYQVESAIFKREEIFLGGRSPGISNSHLVLDEVYLHELELSPPL